jgi:hypothetical protein
MSESWAIRINDGRSRLRDEPSGRPHQPQRGPPAGQADLRFPADARQHTGESIRAGGCDEKLTGRNTGTAAYHNGLRVEGVNGVGDAYTQSRADQGDQLTRSGVAGVAGWDKLAGGAVAGVAGEPVELAARSQRLK